MFSVWIVYVNIDSTLYVYLTDKQQIDGFEYDGMSHKIYAENMVEYRNIIYDIFIWSNHIYKLVGVDCKIKYSFVDELDTYNLKRYVENVFNDEQYKYRTRKTRDYLLKLSWEIVNKQIDFRKREDVIKELAPKKYLSHKDLKELESLEGD